LGLSGAAHFLAELTDEYIPDAVISDFYQLADALFMPSFEEGFGIPDPGGGAGGNAHLLLGYPAPTQAGRRSCNLFYPPNEDPEKVGNDHWKN
jgi:hypothetical protein